MAGGILSRLARRYSTTTVEVAPMGPPTSATETSRVSARTGWWSMTTSGKCRLGSEWFPCSGCVSTMQIMS